MYISTCIQTYEYLPKFSEGNQYTEFYHKHKSGNNFFKMKLTKNDLSNNCVKIFKANSTRFVGNFSQQIFSVHLLDNLCLDPIVIKLQSSHKVTPLFDIDTYFVILNLNQMYYILEQ